MNLKTDGEWLHIKRPPLVGRGVKVQQAFDPLTAVLALLDPGIEWTEAERFPYYGGT